MNERRELLCEDCGREYTVWFADNDFWNAVMRKRGTQPNEPYLCATCFLIRADLAGISWRGRVSNGDAHTPTPGSPARNLRGLPTLGATPASSNPYRKGDSA